MSSLYKDKDSEIGQTLKWCFGLSLLDPSEVSDAFVEDLMPMATSEILPFCDYLLENYIADDALFPPTMWASNSLHSDRTTNACESFHAQFGTNFDESHPNIFKFTEVLKQYQHEIYILIRSASKEATQSYRRDFLHKKALLEDNLNEYKKGRIDRYTFVKKSSYHYRKRSN